MLSSADVNLLMKKKSAGSGLIFLAVFLADAAFLAAAFLKLIPVDMPAAIAVFIVGLAVALILTAFVSKRYRYIRGKAFIVYTYGLPGLPEMAETDPLMEALKKKIPEPVSLLPAPLLAASPEEADTIVSVNWVPVNTGNYNLQAGGAGTAYQAAKGYKVVGRVTLVDMRSTSPFYTAYNASFDGGQLPQQVMFGLNDKIILGEVPDEKIRRFLEAMPKK